MVSPFQNRASAHSSPFPHITCFTNIHRLANTTFSFQFHRHSSPPPPPPPPPVMKICKRGRQRAQFHTQNKHRSSQLSSLQAMTEAIVNPATQRYALVTGGNKGIGFEICRNLASRGIMVILTCRNQQRGIEARDRINESGVSKNVIFHQLDVIDAATIHAAVEFIKTEYGRLDILVNNAGIHGLQVDGDSLILQELIEADVASLINVEKQEEVQLKSNGKIIETLKGAEECVQTNYYGLKTLTEALIPLLQLSNSPRIVSVSSTLGAIKLVSNKWAQEVLSDEERLTEERIEEVVQKFLKNFREGALEVNEWPSHFAAYKVSKAAVNAYTRCVAKEHPSFCINSVCPGLIRTDLTCNLGPFSSEEAAEVVAKLALVPDGGPSGSFFEAWRREEVLSLY